MYNSYHIISVSLVITIHNEAYKPRILTRGIVESFLQRRPGLKTVIGKSISIIARYQANPVRQKWVSVVE